MKIFSKGAVLVAILSMIVLASCAEPPDDPDPSTPAPYALAQMSICPPNVPISGNSPKTVAEDTSFRKASYFDAHINPDDGYDGLDWTGAAAGETPGGMNSRLINVGYVYPGIPGLTTGVDFPRSEQHGGEIAAPAEPNQWAKTASNNHGGRYPGMSDIGRAGVRNNTGNRFGFGNDCSIGDGSLSINTNSHPTNIPRGRAAWWALRAPYGDMRVGGFGGTPNNPKTGIQWVAADFTSNTNANGLHGYAYVYNRPETSWIQMNDGGGLGRAKTRCLYGSTLSSSSAVMTSSWSVNSPDGIASVDDTVCGRVSSRGAAWGGTHTDQLVQTGGGVLNGNSNSIRNNFNIEFRCKGYNISQDVPYCRSYNRNMSVRNTVVNLVDGSKPMLFRNRQAGYLGTAGNSFPGNDVVVSNPYQTTNGLNGKYLAGGPFNGVTNWSRGHVYSMWSAADPGLGLGSASEYIHTAFSNNPVSRPGWSGAVLGDKEWKKDNLAKCSIWLPTPNYAGSSATNPNTSYRLVPKGNYYNPTSPNLNVGPARNAGVCNTWYYNFNLYDTRTITSTVGLYAMAMCAKKYTFSASYTGLALGTVGEPNYPSQCHDTPLPIDNSNPNIKNTITSQASSHGTNAKWLKGNINMKIVASDPDGFHGAGLRGAYGSLSTSGIVTQADFSYFDKDGDKNGQRDSLGILGGLADSFPGCYFYPAYTNGATTVRAGNTSTYSKNCSTSSINYNNGATLNFRTRAMDNAMNAANANQFGYKVDNMVPTASIAPASDLSQNGKITVSAADTHSGVRSVRYCYTSPSSTCTPSSLLKPTETTASVVSSGSYNTTLPNGNHKIRVLTEDLAGNTTTTEKNLLVDGAAPTLAVVGEPTNWVNSNVNVSMRGNDVHSGVKHIVLGLSASSGTGDFPGWTGGKDYTPAPGVLRYNNKTFTNEGVQNYIAVAQDRLGNNSPQRPFTLKIDKTNPTNSITPTGNFSTGNVEVTAADALSGVRSVRYCYTSVSSTCTPSSLLKPTETPASTVPSGTYTAALPSGHHKVRVLTEDLAGNTTLTEKNIIVDNVPPTLTVLGEPAGWVNSNVNISMRANDADSGVSAIVLGSTGGTATANFPGFSGTENYTPLPGVLRYNNKTFTNEGIQNYIAVAQDAVGNNSPIKPFTIKIDKTNPTLTLQPIGSVTGNNAVVLNARNIDTLSGPGSGYFEFCASSSACSNPNNAGWTPLSTAGSKPCFAGDLSQTTGSITGTGSGNTKNYSCVLPSNWARTTDNVTYIRFRSNDIAGNVGVTNSSMVTWSQAVNDCPLVP